jgi:hypothetical protein
MMRIVVPSMCSSCGRVVRVAWCTFININPATGYQFHFASDQIGSGQGYLIDIQNGDIRRE